MTWRMIGRIGDFCRFRVSHFRKFIFPHPGFYKSHQLTFLTYFARYSNKTVSATAGKSVMVEAWRTRTSIAARRGNTRGLKYSKYLEISSTNFLQNMLFRVLGVNLHKLPSRRNLNDGRSCFFYTSPGCCTFQRTITRTKSFRRMQFLWRPD